LFPSERIFCLRSIFAGSSPLILSSKRYFCPEYSDLKSGVRFFFLVGMSSRTTPRSLNISFANCLNSDSFIPGDSPNAQFDYPVGLDAYDPHGTSGYPLGYWTAGVLCRKCTQSIRSERVNEFRRSSALRHRNGLSP
jgi:hypothetical protein